ncbi:MAG: translation elongation factor Ts [FCB group bacterium]|nr:translation elongation factor Ts [FCB group bacterium]
MGISAAAVKDLRARTGAGMMDCKKALVEADGDTEKAIEALRKAGIAKAEKKSGRAANDGAISTYIHPGAKLGVLLEVNCETDFVAKTPDFQQFTKDVAMHIAASNPLVVSREELDPGVVEKEREIFTELTRKSGKPEKIIPKIVEGRIEKFYGEVVLLEQSFVKDPDKTVKDLLTETIAKLGENITISRFARFELGEVSKCAPAAD